MNKLGSYYIELNDSLGENFTEYEFNTDGIPLVRFQRSHDWQHNPVTVCQYALKQFNQFVKTGDEQAVVLFLKQAEWLFKNSENGPDDSTVWCYHINIPFYKLKSPWISGMAQGEALSVLLRAHQLTAEQKYWELANRAWNIFHIPVENGGVLNTYPDGSPVIEEYPTNPGSAVLNGFILALFGIYDYMIVTQNQAVEQFFQDCIISLKMNLNRYDTSFWSLYDLYDPLRLTSRAYHKLHLVLLDALAEISGENSFHQISERWHGYLNSPVCNLKWAITKTKQRILYRWKN